jgi:hypothetical protein
MKRSGDTSLGVVLTVLGLCSGVRAEENASVPPSTPSSPTLGCKTAVPESVRMIVMDLKSQVDDVKLGDTLSQTVAAAAARLPGYTVTSARDLRTAVSHEANRQLLGCDADTDCLAEIADAVDAELLVYGAVEQADGVPVIALTLLNARALVVVNRVSFAWRGDQATLVDVAASATEHLLLTPSQRPPGAIRLVEVPPGARVFVDGKPRLAWTRESLLADIPSGPHEISVVVEKKLPFVASVVVKSNEVVTLTPTFEDEPVPALALVGGAVAVAGLGVATTAGVVWALMRGDVTATAAVAAYGVNDVERVRSAK